MLLARQQTRRSANPLCAAIDAGGYDVLRLLYEFPSCSLNIYEFLQVAQPFGPRYFLDSADGFHLQEDVTKPMIFVSADPGFAPMRAFLWKRLAMKHGTRTFAPRLRARLPAMFNSQCRVFRPGNPGGIDGSC